MASSNIKNSCYPYFMFFEKESVFRFQWIALKNSSLSFIVYEDGQVFGENYTFEYKYSLQLTFTGT